jgi:hypothetical protein
MLRAISFPGRVLMELFIPLVAARGQKITFRSSHRRWWVPLAPRIRPLPVGTPASVTCPSLIPQTSTSTDRPNLKS